MKINWIKFDRALGNKKILKISAMEYQKLVGNELPKGTWYLLNKSALAKHLREKGYSMKVETVAMNVIVIEKEKKK